MDDVTLPAGDEPQKRPWLEATLDDIAKVDIEKPIAGSKETIAHKLCDAYFAAAKEGEARGDVSAHRVYLMLAALTQMYPKMSDPMEPYGPMMVLSDKNRTPIPADYRGGVAEIAALAARAKNHVLRARLSDLAWLLERKRVACAHAAIESFVAIVHQIEAHANEKADKTENEPEIIAEIRALGAIGHDASDCLRRALQIGNAIGRDKSEVAAPRSLAIELRKRTIELNKPTTVYRFSKLDLDFGLSDPAEVGADIETHLAIKGREDEVNNTVNLWRLAAEAYHRAGRDADQNRCLSEAAERWATEAKAKSEPAMLLSHYLESAISQLHGVPGKGERRRELQQMLVTAQAGISEEMRPYSVLLEYDALAELTEKELRGQKLKDKLLAFARIWMSPDPAELVEQAKASIKDSPLSTFFETAHIDREGKTLARSGASSKDGDNESGAIDQRIAQAESFRRAYIVGGRIDPARRMVIDHHALSDDVLLWLLAASPMVPPELRRTLANGFLRFFQGDMTSALYILTPLLEPIFRFVLKKAGHDVTVFDPNTKLQRDKILSNFFETMREPVEAIFSKELTADLDRVFNKRPGPALRHSLAHGLLHDGHPYEADAIYGCWLIYRLCVAPLHFIKDKINLPIDDE
jgi:hypothetical protein